jgi:hypothetical protein
MPTVKTTRRPAQELRATIDRLPLDVREAVLEGIQSQRIIAGAHVDGTGGVCPMAAADVRWLQVSKSSVEVAKEAAWAWDRYAGARSLRPATKRQLIALQAMLEASILEETARTDVPLADVIAEHRLAMERGAFAPAPVETSFTAPLPSRPAADDATFAPLPSRPAADEAPAAPIAPRRRRDTRETGERDRSSELSEREGWSWLRPFRNYDQYEEALVRALAELDRHEAELDEAVAR